MDPQTQHDDVKKPERAQHQPPPPSHLPAEILSFLEPALGSRDPDPRGRETLGGVSRIHEIRSAHKTLGDPVELARARGVLGEAPLLPEPGYAGERGHLDRSVHD